MKQTSFPYIVACLFKKVSWALVALMTLLVVLPPQVVSANTITVNTRIYRGEKTDGYCSLYEAYEAAIYNTPVDVCSAGTSGTDTIVFSESGEIAFTVALPIMAGGPIVIDGTGQTITLKGNPNSSSVFSVPSGTSLQLSNLTLTSAIGGVFVSGGSLTVSDVQFSAFTSQAINLQSGTLSVQGGSFISNVTGIYMKAGTTTIDGATFSGNSGLAINNGGSTLAITNATFTGNSPAGAIYSSIGMTISDSLLTDNQGTSGAALMAKGSATVSGCTFSGNTASTGNGGAINSANNLTITSSTFSENSAAQNGAAIYHAGFDLTVSGSTFSQNTTTGSSLTDGFGGAIFIQSWTAEIVNSTLAGNTARDGAGIYALDGAITLKNNTLAQNTNLAGDSAATLHLASPKATTLTNSLIAATTQGVNCLLTTTTGQNNLSTDASCGTIASQITSQALAIGTLDSYGGLTETIPLLPGSAAIDAGDDTTCASSPVNGLDQRGVARPVGSHCDIGAFESSGFTLAKSSGDNQSANIYQTFAYPLVVSVTSNVTPAEPVDGGWITLTAPETGASANFTVNPEVISGGSASFTAEANETIGTFGVTASTAGADAVEFQLSNVDEAALPGPVLTVTTTQEHSVGVCGERDCTLREAILTANSSPGSNTILFGISGEITLNSELPVILPAGGALTIDGSGQSIVIDGVDTYRIFQADSGAALTLQALTVQNGAVSYQASDTGDGGAGLYNLGGTVQLIDCTFSGHSAGENASGGGAVFNGYGGSLTVDGTTFTDNHATSGDGGALLNAGLGTVTVSNSTFSGNSAGVYGGAVANWGESADSQSAITLTHTTFTGNSATLQGNAYYGKWSSLILKNSIISGEVGLTGCFTDSATISDGGGNVAWQAASCPGLNADPKLGPLADNGGLTPTHLLQAGSAALERGVSANCLTEDQVGTDRPQPSGSTCDVGAVESGLRPPPEIFIAFNPTAAVMQESAALVYSITNPNTTGTGFTGISFTHTLPAGLTIADPAGVVNTGCAGTVTAVPGQTTISVSNGTLGLNKTCTIQLNVTGSAVGSYSTATGPVSSSESGEGSNSNTAVLTVGKWMTTTAVTSHTPSPSTVGLSVSVGFSVTVQSPGSGYPGGTVRVSDGEKQCEGTLSLGVGSCSLTLTTAGSHTLTAVYLGDENMAGSTSAQVSHTVNRASTTTMISGHTPAPSVTGESVLVSFSVTTPTPQSGSLTGQVTVTDGSQTCQGALVDGAGSCSITFSQAGSRSLTATYEGNAYFSTSVSTAVVHVVDQAETSLTLTASRSSSVYGQPVTLTAEVTVEAPGTGAPTGSITFKDGTEILKVVEVDDTGGAIFTTSLLMPGTRILTAVYAGDANYESSVGAVSEALLVEKAESTVALDVSVNPSRYGESVSVSATVSAVSPGEGIPDGTVTFQIDGEDVLGCIGQPVVDGAVTCPLTALAVGAYQVSANYSGSDGYDSSSASYTQTVIKAETTLSVNIVDGDNYHLGEPLTVEFTVTANAPGSGTPGGMVTVNVGDASCSVDVTEGSCVLYPDTEGSYPFSASYSGDVSFESSAVAGIVVHVSDKLSTYLPIVLR